MCEGLRSLDMHFQRARVSNDNLMDPTVRGGESGPDFSRSGGVILQHEPSATWHDNSRQGSAEYLSASVTLMMWMNIEQLKRTTHFCRNRVLRK